MTDMRRFQQATRPTEIRVLVDTLPVRSSRSSRMVGSMRRLLPERPIRDGRALHVGQGGKVMATIKQARMIRGKQYHLGGTVSSMKQLSPMRHATVQVWVKPLDTGVNPADGNPLKVSSQRLSSGTQRNTSAQAVVGTERT